MKRNALVIALAGVAIAVAAWKLVPAGTRAPATPEPVTSPGVASPNAPTVSPASAAAAGAAGYVVHFDKNGNIIQTDAPLSDAQFNAVLEQSINTSHEGLVVENSPVPGGGVMINLQGRFMTTSTATVDANGKLVVPCLTNENDVKAFETTKAAETAAGKE